MFFFYWIIFLFIGFEKLRKSQGEKALEVTKPVFLPLHPLFPGTYRGNSASRLSANCCVFYIFSLLYHIFLLMSYRIKIYNQYHYAYYICTLYLYLIYLHLIYLHLIYSHLIYLHLIYLHLIYLHLIIWYICIWYIWIWYICIWYIYIWYICIWSFNISAFDIFTTQIHFYIIPKNPQMCPAHRDLPTPSHPHSRLNLPHPIPSHTYNGLKTFSLSTTPSGRSPPSAQTFVPSTVAYRHKSTKLPSSTTKHS